MDQWSEVPALVQTLPDPVTFRRSLRERIQHAYDELYRARPVVTVPEDTFDMQRRLAATRELFKDYSDAFRDAVKLLAQLQEEELTEAVGEQEGQPNQGLTIPDPEGDVVLSLDFSSEHQIDADQVQAALRAVMIDRYAPAIGDLDADQWEDFVSSLVDITVGTLVALGKFELQVSKVRQYADTLAREGHDQLAAVVRSAIGNPKRVYKGVATKRKGPPQ